MFSITYMSMFHFLLGLKINQNDLGIKISQYKYVRDILVCFHIIECKPMTTPFLLGVHPKDGKDTPLVGCTMYIQLVRSLLYLTHAHPNLSYAIAIISRYMHEPHNLQWKKKSVISLSLVEAKYKGVVNITIQAIWLQNLLTKLGIIFHRLTII